MSDDTERVAHLERELARERAARERAEAALQAKSLQVDARNQDLKRSNEELERFAYVASHDLRAPLRSIGGFAQLLRKREAEALSDTGQEYLELVLESVAQMEALIGDLLDFSRAQRVPVPDDPVVLGDLLANVCTRLDAQINEVGARVDCDALPTVRGHAGLLGQLFQNLVGNGIKFARAGVTPTVSVTARPVDGGMSCIEITDNGIGIKQAHLTAVFEMFHRLHSADEYPGTGIGLALSAKIAERHGGYIDVTSEPGIGSTFRVFLPGAADAAAAGDG